MWQKILMIVNDQGGGVMHWNKQGVSPTLRSQMKHHEPILVLEIHDDSDAKKILRCEDKGY